MVEEKASAGKPEAKVPAGDVESSVLQERERVKEADVSVEAKVPASDVESSVLQERARSKEITTLVARLNLPYSVGEGLIASGAPLDVARVALLDEVANRADASPTQSPVFLKRDGRDETVTRRDAMENALLHRSNAAGVELTEAGREYRGLTVMEIATRCAAIDGAPVRGMGRHEIATRAMHSTEFPLVLSGVMNKTLRASYDLQPQAFKVFCKKVSVSDFRPVTRAQVGGASQMKKVLEGGEFQRGYLSEAAESYSVESYGSIIAVTRQMLINDDLHAFTRMAEICGSAIARLESDVVWGVLTENKAMADGKPLFSADHRNLQDPGTGISVTSISAARKSMRTQTGLDPTDMVDVEPSYLLVPAALETSAEQFVARNMVPTQVGQVVPETLRSLQVIAEPRLDVNSAASWYLVASPTRIDTIEYAYLNGQGASLTSREGFEVDGLEFKCRHDFGVKAIDWRGFYKNAGKSS